MFTLNRDEIDEFDINRASEFVDFWSQYYSYRVPELNAEGMIDYYAELNLGRDLTTENACKLLRWKDPHLLTHRILTGPNTGQDNPRVARVLNNLSAINCFRRGDLTEEQIINIVSDIFPHGIVFRGYLLHIAIPYRYPIVDQHVFRVYKLHTGATIEQTWSTYLGYKQYFSQLAQAIGVAATDNNVA